MEEVLTERAPRALTTSASYEGKLPAPTGAVPQECSEQDHRAIKRQIRRQPAFPFFSLTPYIAYFCNHLLTRMEYRQIL